MQTLSAPLRYGIASTLLVLVFITPLPAQTAKAAPPGGFPTAGPGLVPGSSEERSSTAIANPAPRPRAPLPTGKAVEAGTADSGEPVIALSKPADYNSQVYYKNRLEFALDSGLLNQNIPFPFDCFMGDNYNSTNLNYTLVPITASLRWQLGNVRGPSILRGNFDLTFSAMVTPIPRGPETHFVGYAMGIRRNFVPRNFKLAPYFEFRAGTGGIDASGPKGVVYGQGQDFVFTLMMGSGFRYNVSPRYSFSAGVEWMHISNLYMSEPKYANYGINVYGPMIGLDIRVGKHGQPKVR